jgi:hypothetical protein
MRHNALSRDGERPSLATIEEVPNERRGGTRQQGNRRLLIERLNEKEKLIGLQSPPRREQMSEEELETEIERQRQEQYSRRGFGQIF